MSLAFSDSMWPHVESLRSQRPLVLCITNSVAANFTANALLALGASPLMAHAPEELEEIVRLSGSLILNIGTLDNVQIASMLKAIEFANQKNIPIIVDPVGAGASCLRTETVKTLLKNSKKLILKGNASEIISLVKNVTSKGVDSLESSEQAVHSARELITEFRIKTIAITGKDDYILDSVSCHRYSNGSPIMTKVTGMGCMLTAIIGAFCSVDANITQAVKHAVTYVGIAGELASIGSHGPGSFPPLFLDKLHSLEKEDIDRILKARPC